ncbi:MAG TPA: LysR family transcriptional regulator [Acidimicrobiales bacterium]|jgi:DNA-binding transcriptional LysR family regulator
MELDLDLGQVRAFVATSEQLHFGRAAAQLFVTQQALSKRIQRLERAIGEQLFVRDTRGVRLTDAGRRFLPHARQLLATADAAAAAARLDSRPLRVDVWGHLQDPLRRLRGLIDRTPDLLVELSMRRSIVTAIEALQRGQIDAAFGRVNDLPHPWPDELAHRLVLLAPLALAVNTDHPLVDASVLHPAELTQWEFWVPAQGSPTELQGYWERFAKHFAIPIYDSGSNLGLDLGLDHVLERVRDDPARVTLLGASWPVPADAGIRMIPLDPTPRYPWSLVWRTADRHPTLSLLLELIADAGTSDGWLAFDPEHDWLPDVDLANLQRLEDR